MKLSVNTIHVLQMNACGLAAILIGILGLFAICSCSTTKVIINQNELPENCDNSGVKTTNTAWNKNIPNVFTVDLDSISEIIINPKDENAIAEVWYSNENQGIKDLCLHCVKTQALILNDYLHSPYKKNGEYVGVNYQTSSDPYVDIRKTYGSSINAY